MAVILMGLSYAFLKTLTWTQYMKMYWKEYNNGYVINSIVDICNGCLDLIDVGLHWYWCPHKNDANLKNRIHQTSMFLNSLAHT